MRRALKFGAQCLAAVTVLYLYVGGSDPGDDISAAIHSSRIVPFAFAFGFTVLFVLLASIRGRR